MSSTSERGVNMRSAPLMETTDAAPEDREWVLVHEPDDEPTVEQDASRADERVSVETEWTFVEPR
jgi:hypothetical protein